jgi:negative regulator of flagellin synthesis FlgM
MGGATPAPAAGSVPGAGPTLPADALSVSSSAYFIALARAHLAKIPDVRVDKVEALRAQLDSDSYSPDGEAVADGIVKDHTPQLAES